MVTKIRARLAQLVWLLAALAALVLAVGALLIALDANRNNAAVELVSCGPEARRELPRTTLPSSKSRRRSRPQAAASSAAAACARPSRKRSA